MEEDVAKPLIFLKHYGLVIGLLMVGLAFFFYGLMQYFAQSSETDVTFHTQSEVQTSQILTQTNIAEITVDIEGAVIHPGMYKLAVQSRLQDLILKAGGYTTTVDHEKVAKGLNLAEKLNDGAKVYVPFINEEETASVGQQTPIKSGQTVLGASSNEGGLININSASSEELDSLPGVGVVTAGKIIANRPYTSIDQLVEKKAVGQSTVEKLKDKITTN